MSAAPAISVIIPVFDKADVLEAVIDAFAAQQGVVFAAPKALEPTQ